MPDGRVLVIGGGGRGVSSSAEVWEPRRLTEEQVRDLAADALICGELGASFRRDFTAGDPQLDGEYLTRCVTCEELRQMVLFRRVADLETGLAVHRERCDQSQPLPQPTEDA